MSQSPRNYSRKSDTEGHQKFPVLKPLDAPLMKRNGHYRDKNLLVNTFVALAAKFFICLREAHVFKGEELDAS